MTGLSALESIACGLRSEEHTSELQSPCNFVCRLLLENIKDSAYHRCTANVRPTTLDHQTTAAHVQNYQHPAPPHFAQELKDATSPTLHLQTMDNTEPT